MNKRSHIHKKADSSASSPVLSQFHPSPFVIQAQSRSQKPLAQTETENREFQQHNVEVTRLQIQAEHGTIAPEGQEQLTVLQAKMSGLLQERLQHASRFSHNFANIPISRPEVLPHQLVQTKLTIGKPGDKYEQEADRVAAQVVNQINAPVSQQAEKNVQREEMSVEEKELQMKPMLQLQPSEVEMAAAPEVEASIKRARGGGQPLADSIQEPMQQAFGADFSRVKVHTDPRANQLNQSIQARAFTTGQDIFFRQGEYNPQSRKGQELLAHELTHVVQQNSGSVQRSPKTQVTSLLHNSTQTVFSNDTHNIQRAKEASEYAHIVIDKNDQGLDKIRDSLNKNGLQTAATRKISLAEGSKQLGHDRHVFMWDATDKGKKGAAMLVKPEGTVTVKIRSKNLTTPGFFFTAGTLKVDNMGQLGQGQPTGAWAYEGNIERKYLFIEGIDKESDPGYENWKNGEGWPEDHLMNAMKGARAIGEARKQQ
jgi:hypothetical protein